jgi:hypothetical protein
VLKRITAKATMTVSGTDAVQRQNQTEGNSCSLVSGAQGGMQWSACAPKINSKKNERETLTERPALVQRIKFWLLRARNGPIGNCSKSRGRKNYLASFRRHPELAEQHGLGETDIF